MSKKKIFSILFALVLAVSLMLVPAVVSANPGTIQVDVNDSGCVTGSGQSDPYSVVYCSIQDAIDDAAPYDTIIVAAGTYDEQVEIDKSLTIQGAGDTTIIQPSTTTASTLTVKSTPWLGGGSKEMAAIVWVDTSGGTVTVKDLKIDGINITETYKPAAIGSNEWVTGLAYLETSGTVDTVTVEDVYISDGIYRTCGIWTSAITATSTVEVKHSTVINNNRAGIYGLGGDLTVDFHHNTLTGPGTLANQVPNGIFLMEDVTGSATYNTVSQYHYSGVTYLGTGIGTYATNAGSITFSHNTISDVDNGFALSAGTTGVTIEYNNVTESWTGVRLESSGTGNNIIRCNTIEGNTYAIRTSSTIADTNVAHCNSFVDNTGTGHAGYEGAVSVYSSATVTLLDATMNWWGDASGPYHSTNPSGTGDAVSDYVDYEPWSFTPDPCEPKSKGFWKNHPESLDAVLHDDVSVSLGDVHEVADFEDAQLVFDNERAKCAEDMLAPQLLAAELNVLHLTHLGIDTSCVAPTISAAQTALAGYTAENRCSLEIKGQDKQPMLALADVLDSFNNGEMCGCACEWD